MAHLKKHFFFYTIILLIGLMAATSYYRFIVVQDYTVGYEGECDPYTEECYVYCEDDDCTEPIYYSWIERNAGLLYQTCGQGLVTECDAAYVCENSDATCEIYFCDAEFEDCDDLTISDLPLSEVNDTEI